MADETSEGKVDQASKAEAAPKPRKRWVLWLIILVLLAGGLVLYLTWDSLLREESEDGDVAVLEPTTTDSEVVPVEENKTDVAAPAASADEWQKYTNANFKFTLEYPGDWSVSDKLPTAKSTSGIKEPLTIYETSATSGSRIVLYANPDGWGGQDMPEVTYTGEWQGNNIKITDTKINTAADTIPEFPIIPGLLSLQLAPTADNFNLSIVGYDFLTDADKANFKKIIESITRT